jgi:hypothetical protein
MRDEPKLATQPADPSTSDIRSMSRRNSAGGSASPPKRFGAPAR